MKQFCDEEGIIIDLVVGKLTLTISNIYAPIKDDPAVIEDMSFKCDDIIFGRDFSLVLDIIKDKKGRTQTTYELFESAQILFINRLIFFVEIVNNSW